MFLKSKGLTFLTRFPVGLNHLREHKFKHSFLDTLNPICICSFDVETLYHFFLHCPKFANERQNLLLKIERIFPDIFKKTDASVTSLLHYDNPSFRLNLTPKYSIHLLNTYYPQKSLSLLSLESLGS